MHYSILNTNDICLLTHENAGLSGNVFTVIIAIFIAVINDSVCICCCVYVLKTVMIIRTSNNYHKSYYVYMYN